MSHFVMSMAFIMIIQFLLSFVPYSYLYLARFMFYITYVH